MSVPTRYRDALRASPVLHDLSDEELDRIFDVGSLQTFPARTRLIDAGALGMEAYVLLRGEATVRLDGGEDVTVGEGEIVGEMALLAEGTNRRNASVETAGELTALVINRHYFEGLLNDSPQLLENVRARIRERAEATG